MRRDNRPSKHGERSIQRTQAVQNLLQAMPLADEMRSMLLLRNLTCQPSLHSHLCTGTAYSRQRQGPGRGRVHAKRR
jgi:hypothetical protein